MFKGLYHYLDKIKFEEQVIQKAKQYQKISDNPMFSDLVVLNSYFSLISQLYEEIYKDINENKDNIMKKRQRYVDENHLTLDELFIKIINYKKEWYEQDLVLNLIKEYKNGKRWINKYRKE